MSDPLFLRHYGESGYKTAVLRSFLSEDVVSDVLVCVGEDYEFGRSPYEQAEALVFPVGSNQCILELDEDSRFVVTINAHPGRLLRGGVARVRSVPFVRFDEAEAFGQAMADQPYADGYCIQTVQMKHLKGV